MHKKIRTRSLSTQIFLMMAVLVALQSIALLSALFLSRVFMALDAEAFRLFENTAISRAETFNTSVKHLVTNLSDETNKLNHRLTLLAHSNSMAPGQLYLDDALYEQAALIGSESLITLLRNNSITGAFVFFDHSNSHKGENAYHSAVYIRNSAPNRSTGDNANYYLELGPAVVSQRNSLTISTNWDLDMYFDDADPGQYAFYTQPVWAADAHPGSELERYGFWATPVAMLKDRQRVVCYTLPLLDEEGKAYGVLGFEISMEQFSSTYLPNSDLPYQNSFYAIANVRDDRIDLGWYIPSGPLANVYLQEGETLALQNPYDSPMQTTHLEGLGEMYCAQQNLQVYSLNSPFHENGWTLIGFVPTAVLHETSASVRSILLTSIFLTTLLSLAAVILLTYFSTRPLSRLPKRILSANPYEEASFEKTGLREIDALTNAIEVMNQNMINTYNSTAKIMDLTSMPLGCYQIINEGGYAILTDYIYTLLELEPDDKNKYIPKDQWETFFAQLTADPAPEYENTYRYHQGENIQWLRILQTDTDTGYVGTILDVTEDIEKSQQLAHELDYDALTHLYSRSAFKREAHNRILAQPDKLGAMIFADLDNLKYINDTFGHDVGDRFLIRAGEMFSQFTQIGGIVSRISGDEFSIYLHGFADKKAALKEIRSQFAKNEEYNMVTPDNATQKIRCSAGLAWYPEDSGNVTDLLKLSDYAMYEAKHNKKGTLYEFNRDSYSQNIFLLENREAINRLIDDELIRFAFQPIVSLATGEIYGYEALMRPLIDNFSSPLEILSVAAAQSKLGQIERLVVMTIMQYVREHRKEIGGRKIFFNSIPNQVLSEEDLLLLRRQYSPIMGSIVMEITEEQNATPQSVEDKAALVKSLGMQLAIDDYGAGYSNEVRILSLHPDVLKIDKAIIENIHEDPQKQQLVENIIYYCKPQGILTIAEGVETQEELVEIVRLDVDCVQGFYTGRPQFTLAPIDPETVKFIRSLH